MSKNPKNPASPPSTPPSDVRDELTRAIDSVEWKELSPHVQRDGVVVVTHPLTLIDVGMKLAEDDSSWLEQKLVGKPSSEQLESWNGEPQRKFRFLIIQPYVLVQEIVQ